MWFKLTTCCEAIRCIFLELSSQQAGFIIPVAVSKTGSAESELPIPLSTSNRLFYSCYSTPLLTTYITLNVTVSGPSIFSLATC